MDFRRRRRINWFNLFCLVIGLIGIGSLLYQHFGVPPVLRERLESLPFWRQVTVPPTPIPIDDGTATLAQADDLVRRGDLSQAMAQYQKAIEIATTSVDILKIQADAYDKQGKGTEAAGRRDLGLRIRTWTAIPLARWAILLAYRGQGQEAVDKALQATTVDPGQGEAWTALILAYDRVENYDAAITAGRRALSLNPNHVEALAYMAEAYADLDPYHKSALESATAAVALNEQNPVAQRNLGWVYERQGNYSKALEAYQKAVDSSPNFSYFHLDLGRMYHTLGQLDKALAEYQKAGDLDKGNPEPFDRIGRVYFDRREYEKAATYFIRATEADPRYAPAYGRLGLTYYNQSAWEKATIPFEKALEIKGNLPPSRLAEYAMELGWSYYRLGKCAEARSSFQKSLEWIAGSTAAGASDIINQTMAGLKACEGK